MDNSLRPGGDIQCHFRCKEAYNAVSPDREPLAEIAQAENALVIKMGLDGKLTEQPAVPGMKLFEGDTVKTGDGGSAMLAEPAGSRVSLGPETSFKLDKYFSSGEQPSLLGQAINGVLYGVNNLVNAVEPEQPPTPSVFLGSRG